MADDLKKTHIILLYAAIAALLILLFGGCAMVVKEDRPIDPLTRKHY